MIEQPPPHLEQLRRALEAGAIDQGTYDAAVAAMNAQVEGGGTIAQGQDATAVGPGGVNVRGDNEGPINLGVLIQQGARPRASAEDLTRAYLARIVTQSNQLPLFVGDGTKAQIQLSAVYTALLTQRSEAEAGMDVAARAARRSPSGERDRRLSPLEVLETEPRLALLGGPGSGKSTFVRFLALSMAGELLNLPGPNLETLTAPLPIDSEDDDKPQPQRWTRGPLLPVIVVLRDLASQLPPPGTPANAQTLWNFIQGQLQQAALGEFVPILKQRLLKSGGLVLFDGLDEVPDADQRRVQVKQAVQDFAASFDLCRYLVTSRTYAYQRQDWKLDGFAQTELLDFTNGQIHGFVEAWYRHMVELYRLSDADAADRAEVLIRTVDRNTRLHELAGRPLLLTLIAQLQTEGGGALPEKREELYDKAVELLLTKWESMKVQVRPDGTKEVEPGLAEWLNADRDDIRRQLNQLAFEAHRDQPALTGTADIRQADLIAALLNASRHREDLNVGLLERYLRDRAGLLAAHGEGMYQFPHRSFQEYLAACHLTDELFPDQLAELARTDPNRWREVTLLAAAKATRGSSLNAWTLAETLCPASPPTETGSEADDWGGLLAGQVLAECADLARVAPRDRPKHERARDWQLHLLRGDTLPANERALAGRSLAVLGDPRDEVLQLEAMQFCLVPPGPFIMGDENSPYEKPRHRVELTYPYLIARYPITVAQWREYVARSDRPVDDERNLRGRTNDPTLYVTWYDAVRFCAFLTEAWREVLPPGFVVTLPSEAEWEKAARGGAQMPVEPVLVAPSQAASQLAAMSDLALRPNSIPHRDYPWDGEFDGELANAEGTIGETSPVGAYAKGVSPYGCEEMSGNVWEWTRSVWGENLLYPEFRYPYDPDDVRREALDAGDEVSRVVRGGSWVLLPGLRALCLSPQASSRVSGPWAGFSCGVAFFPCFVTPGSVASGLRCSGSLPPEGVRGSLPPPRVARSFRLSSALRSETAGQAVWRGRARRLVEQQPRQRALCLSQQESTRQSEQQPGLPGGVAFGPRSSLLSSGPAARRDGAPAPPCRRAPVMRADPYEPIVPPRRRKKNSARWVWSAREPRGRARRGIARAGRIPKPGTARPPGPPLPTPPYSFSRLFALDMIGTRRRHADGRHVLGDHGMGQSVARVSQDRPRQAPPGQCRGIRVSGRRSAARSPGGTAERALPSRRLLPFLHSRAQATQDQRRTFSRPGGASRPVQPDQTPVRGPVHCSQLRQPQRQGYAPGAGSPPGSGTALPLCATHRCRPALPVARPPAIAQQTRASDRGRRGAGAGGQHSRQRRRRARQRIHHGPLPGRRPARSLPPARIAHRQPDLPVLVQRLPGRLRLVRAARIGLWSLREIRGRFCAIQ